MTAWGESGRRVRVAFLLLPLSPIPPASNGLHVKVPYLGIVCPELPRSHCGFGREVVYQKECLNCLGVKISFKVGVGD